MVHVISKETAKRSFTVAAPNVWSSLSVYFLKQTENTFYNNNSIHDEPYPPQRHSAATVASLILTARRSTNLLLC